MKLLTVLIFAATALCHGGSKTMPNGLTWEQWHMIEEHGLDQFDSDTIFKLHDLRNSGQWNDKDILNLYGLLHQLVGDGSGMGTHNHENEQFSESDRQMVVKTILDLIDTNHDGEISLDEFKAFHKSGKKLPDLGFGQGHHLDFEEEYEQHHWLKYHADSDPDVLIKHKEDIEHELLHHEHEIDESHNDNLGLRKITNSFLSNINVNNVSPKYLI
jgi:hypothetical protein